MDPLGLALEHFDGAGRYRDDDHGHALDTTGELDGASFDGALELGALLHDDPRVTECLARHAYRYAVGHLETPGEAAVIAALNKDFEQHGYQMTALLRAVVQSDGFRFAGGAQQ
jgi:hypothetical protein